MMPSILLPQKVNQMLDPVLFKILHKIKCLWSFEDLILHLSERKVWYLLVAAGASYLLQRWQCVQKTPTSTDGEDERKNPPFSPPFTAKREFHLSLSNSVQTICNALHNTTSGIASMCQMLSNDGLDILVDKGITSCPQEVQSNRNADDIFSVNPIHVKTEHSVLASNCNLNITSDAVMKEQQLKDESLTSTSPCCSSTEAGISGAVNHSSVLQSYDVPFQFHEKEQSYEPIWQYGFYQSVDKEPKSQSIELHRHEMNTALGEDLGDNQRDAFDLIQKQSHEASQYPNCVIAVQALIPAATRMFLKP